MANRPGIRHRRREPAEVERDARAVELRKANLSYQQIADELGYASKSSAHEAVRRGLADSVAESNDEVRALELERLDHLYRRALQVLSQRHLFVSQGRVAIHPTTGEPLIDSGPVLAAIDRALKVMDRRAKLLGLDAPIKINNITQSAIEAEIERLEKELGLPTTEG